MILFTASWCPHCQKVKKFLDDNPIISSEALSLYSDPSDPIVYICDVDKDFDTPTLHGVKQLPALLRTDGTLMVESSDIIEHIKEELA